MEYTKEQFIADVTAEAKALRENTTPEERYRLNFDTLQPEHMEKCIYGQMTGDCDSKRAVDLISKCAHRYIVDNSFSRIRNNGFAQIKEHINGEHVEDLYSNRHHSSVCHYSAVEGYILVPGANNKNLIAFIKGETDELKLTF